MKFTSLLFSCAVAQAQVVFLLQSTPEIMRGSEQQLTLKTFAEQTREVSSLDLPLPKSGLYLILSAPNPPLFVVDKYRGQGTIIDLRDGTPRMHEFKLLGDDGTVPKACVGLSVVRSKGLLGVRVDCRFAGAFKQDRQDGYYWGFIDSINEGIIQLRKQELQSGFEEFAVSHDVPGLNAKSGDFYGLDSDRRIFVKGLQPINLGITYPEVTRGVPDPKETDDILALTPELMAIGAMGSRNTPSRRILAYSRETQKWSKFTVNHSGGHFWIKAAGNFLTGGLSGRDTEEAFFKPPSKEEAKDDDAMERRMARTHLTQFPKETTRSRFGQNRGVPPGKLFVFDVKTGEQWWLDTKEPDSEILTVGNRSIYLRINDTLWRRSLLPNGQFGEPVKLFQEDWLYDVHWGIFRAD